MRVRNLAHILLKALRNLTYILLAGFIFCYHSEWMFWLGRKPDFHPFEAVLTWLAYSYTTFFFLAAVRFFRVQTFYS